MWSVRLAPAADRDVDEILDYSQRAFGDLARHRYRGLLQTAFNDLATDPDRSGARHRNDLVPGARTYHLLHSRERAAGLYGVVRRPRHLLLFRLPGSKLVEIGRILHDSMDIVRHLPPDYPPK